MTHQVEPLTGNLLKGVAGAISLIPFKYRILKPREYALITSALPGSEFVSATEDIYTSRAELQFAKGDKVTLCDKRILTIESIKPNIQQNYYKGAVVIGYSISLS